MCEDCDENSSTLPNGPNGDPGNSGTNGLNFIQGSGVPLISGNSGDSYLNILTYDLYSCSGGTSWTITGNIKGTNGTNGSGLVKYVQSVLIPVPIAGVVTQTILGATLTSYGIVSTPVPGVLAPPAGFEYGTQVSDLLIMIYEYLPSSTTWQKINDSRNNISINSSGDITIATSGFTSIPNKVRYVIIG